ncbi:MAG: hypothetical protein DMG97_04575 [Acidobacteria bacterium]|nr:MAG: hypothetical protein DMG97_04575 [Acidobacteriota bacterium]
MSAQELHAFTHFAKEFRECALGRDDVRMQLGGPKHHVPSLAYDEVAQERNHIRADVNKKHATEVQPVVRESNNCSGKQPSALYPGQQESVGVNKFVSGSQFLN